MSTYVMRRAPRHGTARLRGLDTHLRYWGPQSAEPPVVLLHGWMDTGDTFQFMVDAFERDFPLVALDWRGFGRSAWPQEGYWFADYYADLEALLDLVSPSAPVRLVGHSMGGNIASMYAGLRPARVRCVANLEGFGLARTTAADAPRTLRKWLDQVTLPPPSKEYDSLEQLTKVIGRRYPRFTPEQAHFMAAAWSTAVDGRLRLLGDTRHQWTNPYRYLREDSEMVWREIQAPLLMVLAEKSEYWGRLGVDGTDAAFQHIFPTIQIAHVAGAGHMMHIEQAQTVAGLVESFLSGC